jgi:hypothetical protein
MIWWIEFSIGGASFTLGNGLRYREMIVMPLENCSGGRSTRIGCNKVEVE